MSRHQHAVKIASVATLVQVTQQNLLQKIQLIEFLGIFLCDFLAVASPMRGWLDMRFLLCIGNATV